MTASARELMDRVRAELAPAESENRLVPLLEQGTADRAVFGRLAAEETVIVTSDWRSFLTVAARSESTARELFAGLAQGEGLALAKLPALAEAGGMDAAAMRDYEPMAGCQAYPAYVAWLAQNGEPADVIVALIANFAAWGDYCGRAAAAARAHYGFDDTACGFFDFFATPVPEVVEQAVTAVQAAMDAGRVSERLARRYGRLFQTYELMFWNTLADTA